MTTSKSALNVDLTLGILAIAGSCGRVPSHVSLKICQTFLSNILHINIVGCTPWFNDSFTWASWITAWNGNQMLSQELISLQSKDILL